MNPRNASRQAHAQQDRQSPPTSVNYDLVAKVCTNYIIHLFASSNYPYPSSRSAWQKHLSAYISLALRVSDLDVTVAIAAMTLLCQYKDASPFSVAYGDDAYRLFLASYIVAAKVMYNPPRSPRFWWRIGNGKFECDELVNMEVELRRVLRWDVQIDHGMFAWFKRVIYCYSASDSDDCIADEWAQENDMRLNPPPPAYQDASHDTQVLEVNHHSSSWGSQPRCAELEHGEARPSSAMDRMVNVIPPQSTGPDDAQRPSITRQGTYSFKQRVFEILLRRPSLPM
ncbi:hypothetical protein BDZ97DRAFT_2056903 [Flammula alnicola]|nr:hypothetical protein BDZ97DRAFT_2056903 [Flammula alnicola]